MADKLRLRGIITPLLTPFAQDGRVEEEALRELVEFQIRSRVNGLFSLGTTGLGPAIEADQRKRIAAIVVEETRGRVPVIVQVGAFDPAASIDLARHAEKIGADALACLTPFYYHPGEEATIDYYEKISRASELPLLVYNIPQNTGNNVDPKLLLRLSKIRNVIGVKDSSRDLTQLLDYLQILPDWFNVFTGTASFLFWALCAGASGGVLANANAFPELFVEILEAYKARDLEKGTALQMKAHSLSEVLSKPPIAPLLETLKMRGLRGGSVKPPLRPMNADEVQALRSSVSRLLPELKLTA